MLNKLHQSHLGQEKTKRLARDVIFWPGMTGEINDMVSRCETCSLHKKKKKKKQQKEPLIPHPVPDLPWQKFGVDLFEDQGTIYVVMVDYLSNYFELRSLGSTTSSTVITFYKQNFARYGIPEEVFSDNGPQFSSKDFKDFAREYGFKHTTSSPAYPQSNGKVEKAVQIVKNILIKCRESRSDPNLAILLYRNTPGDGIPSPAQLLMGRRTSTTLPTSRSLLKPEKQPDSKERQKKIKEKQKHFFDKGAKELPPLQIGNRVMMQDDRDGRWKPARVVALDDSPRSYIIKTEGPGGIYRRNRRHLRKVPDNQQQVPNGLGSHIADDIEDDQVDDDTRAKPPPERRYPRRTTKAPNRLDL